MKVLGIDEAGRGPVIGPMVLAAVMVDEKDLEKLEQLGLKDSKVLSPLQRERLFDVLGKLDYVESAIQEAQPKDIDDALNSPNLNLNSFEALHSALLINKLKPDKVILDLPSNNAKAYINQVRLNLIVNPEIIAEHKADANYAVVSGASILAKVTRDRAIEELKRKHNINIGSGYPSDPMTKAFLAKHYADKKYEGIFRKTWASYKNIVSGKAQKGLGDF